MSNEPSPSGGQWSDKRLYTEAEVIVAGLFGVWAVYKSLQQVRDGTRREYTTLLAEAEKQRDEALAKYADLEELDKLLVKRTHDNTVDLVEESRLLRTQLEEAEKQLKEWETMSVSVREKYMYRMQRYCLDTQQEATDGE